MKKLAFVLTLFLLLCSCSAPKAQKSKQYTATFLDVFDTVTTIVGSAESKQAFETAVKPIHDDLMFYHQLFDIYKVYDGVTNLKTVNSNAHKEPIVVNSAILQLLQDCKDYYTATNGIFNPAMGSVLSLWHDAREHGINNPETAYLPDYIKLKEASNHTDPENIVLDFAAGTVFISDPLLKIDVGGIAKGWAVQKVCEKVQQKLLISVGGNVYATGPKDENGTPWSVGVANPDGGDSLHILNITGGSVVTSGSYQRAFSVNGKLYHHIIDPVSLYPLNLWTSVTIISNNSGLADVLSTSLFLLSREEGQALLSKYSAEAMWVDTEKNQFYSSGFKDLIKS